MNNVSVIKPILNPSNRLKRVCGYARVSTIDEHQDTSYNTQISELEELIKSAVFTLGVADFFIELILLSLILHKFRIHQLENQRYIFL